MSAPRIACPCCGVESRNPGDVAHRFCARCGFHVAAIAWRWIAERGAGPYTEGPEGALPPVVPYLIWSHEHGAWWRPGAAGYAPHPMLAGVYSRERALAIAARALPGSREGIPNELPLPLSDLEAAGILDAWHVVEAPPA